MHTLAHKLTHNSLSASLIPSHQYLVSYSVQYWNLMSVQANNKYFPEEENSVKEIPPYPSPLEKLRCWLPLAKSLQKTTNEIGFNVTNF